MNATPQVIAAMAETRDALRRFVAGKSWRQAGAELGISHGVLHSFATDRWDHVSWPQFARIRESLGLPPLGEPVLAIPCLDCGDLHTGRCHNLPVERVLVVRRRPELPGWLRFAARALRDLETKRRSAP